ncbi:hypothetical protein ACOSP7_004948 [Xanthoceras sorbifolium]
MFVRSQLGVLEEDRNMVGWSFLHFVFYYRSLVGRKLTSKSFLLLVLAWYTRKEFASLGAVVRNCRSKVVLARCYLSGRGLFPQCAQAEAMCFRLSIALEAGFSPILLESDALSVVNLVISKSPSYSEIGLFILDILNLLEYSSVCGVSYSHRCTNMVDHSLAKLVFSFSSETIWVADFPPSVENYASTDLAGL